MKKRVIVVILLFLATYTLYAQEKSKFNYFLTYKHSFGLREKNVLWDRNDNLYSNAIFVSGIYSINRLFACGIGFGTDVLENPHYTTFPIFASVQITPFDNKKIFFYNDTGYSLDTKISYPGLYFALGVGYNYMLKEHFGFSFKLGYNLNQIENIIVTNNDETQTHSNTYRHSLSASIGIVF